MQRSQRLCGHTFYCEHLWEIEKFCEPFLPVKMGPRWSFLIKKVSKLSWNCPLNVSHTYNGCFKDLQSVRALFKLPKRQFLIHTSNVSIIIFKQNSPPTPWDPYLQHRTTVYSFMKNKLLSSKLSFWWTFLAYLAPKLLNFNSKRVWEES